MERKFKFEVGQYVKIADILLKINKDLPKYPCKITYRFFDRRNDVYILEVGENEETVFLETDLVLYSTDENGGTIQQMQKDILALQKRITDLEFEVSKTNQIYNGFSLSTSKVASGNEIRYKEAEDTQETKR